MRARSRCIIEQIRGLPTGTGKHAWRFSVGFWPSDPSWRQSAEISRITYESDTFDDMDKIWSSL